MNEDQEFDENGELIFHLGPEDSALVVRADGSVELVSREFEKKGETDYLGDFEDLNKTFSLVLALAASLENEQLYGQIFHNLNMVLMKQWDRLSDDKKKEIVELRQARVREGLEEKKKRLDSFRERMNKYKDSFLNDEQKKMHEDFESAREDFERMQHESAGPFGPEGPLRRRKKRKRNPLAMLKDVNWNPYDVTLKANRVDGRHSPFKGNYKLDDPPDEED